MENNYDVGIANRFALFMEEGENSLTAIRKKINKETRIKDKLTKKESTDTTKVEPVNTQEKPKKSAESKPATNDVTVPKKEVKDKKNEAAKGKDKKFNDNAKRKEKEPQDKNRSNKVNENGPQENEVKEGNNKSADSAANTRKNYENRKNRDKKFENNDQFQSKTSPTSSKKFTKDDWSYKEGNGDSNEHNQFEDDRNVKENGHGSYNDVKPRGGRVNRGGRGGRNNAYSGGDRRREFDQTNENRDEFDTNKNESNGENKAEVDPENTENQKDDKNETAESEGNETGEQKEVKEFLTLDEWKKKQGARQKPQYNLRKAGEGEDLTQWKNMRELQKKKDEAFLKNGNGSGNQPASNNENEDENAANENVQRVARQKHIDINVHFRDAPVRGRGGRVIRSNRFGYKGGNFEANENFGGEPRPFRKPRDAPPSGRGGHRQNAPKMDDEHAFPSLG